ncbi:hypothetical protein [Sorangium sp. So ce513]
MKISSVDDDERGAEIAGRRGCAAPAGRGRRYRTSFESSRMYDTW